MSKIQEGSKSILVRRLIDSVAPLLKNETDFRRWEREFTSTVNASEEIKTSPRLKRHAAEIVSRMQEKVPGVTVDLPPVDLPALMQVVDETLGRGYRPAVSLDTILDPKLPTLDQVIENERSDYHAARARAFQTKLQEFAEEYAKCREHPFIRRFDLTFCHGEMGEQSSYIVVGTSVGSSKAGTPYNANCTTGNHRKIKDASEELLVHSGGRPLSACHESAEGDRFFVWLLHYRPGTQLRFWVNTTNEGNVRGDAPAGNRRVVITDSPTGWAPVRGG